MKKNAALDRLERAVGTWSVTGSHPYLPGRVLRGRVTFERIEDGAFLRMRSKMDDREIPEGVAIFGTDDDAGTCTLIYFDERGVSRNYDVTIDDDGFTWSRHTASFAQRYRVTFAEDGRTMKGEGTMRKDGGAFEPDLSLSYERVDAR